MHRLLRFLFSFVTELFFPRRCPVCDRVLSFRQGLAGPGVCLSCRGVLRPVAGPRCLRCGKALLTEAEFCPDCRRRKRHFRQNVALWEYDEAARASVARFKYHGRSEYAGWYAEELLRLRGREIKRFSCEAVVPVPVHRSRLVRRGYNQAGLLAEELAARLALPYRPELLLRRKKTVPQKELFSPTARARNLQSALAVPARAVLPRSVLLVDDIYTTGSTLEACSLALLEAGVKEVYCVTLCIVPDR